MRIVCISDTHNRHDEINVPEGDILVHSGDFTSLGKIEEINKFNEWLGTLPHKHKVIVAGNHDKLFEYNGSLARTLITNATYLENSGTRIKGLNFWGSPITPRYFDWAFNQERGWPIKRFWDIIPDDTDVLITHGPPFSILDETRMGEFAGCEELLKRVREVKPRWHIFGHIHEGYGAFREGETLYVNASSLNYKYQAVNLPFIIETR